jgi:hypothetical protein
LQPAPRTVSSSRDLRLLKAQRGSFRKSPF